jgi:hypothetical protein
MDKRLIKSYVWHGDECFFVSTCDRDSSAMLGPRRYAETIVWGFDWEKNEKGGLLYQDSSYEGSIKIHIRTCERIYSDGNPETWEE